MHLPQSFTALSRHTEPPWVERGPTLRPPNPGKITQLLLDNVHPKAVSERLGHSSIANTMDMYSHVMPGMQKEAADKIDKAFGATKQPNGDAG
jgi:hypothetical protein